MPQYKPSDDHWLSRMAAIEGRPEPEPVDYCASCGEPLDVEDGDEECRVCSSQASFEVTGTITAYFEDPKLYAEYKKGQDELARFLLKEIER